MAENGEKWIKQASGWEWRKRTDAYKAEIARVTGGVVPYYWDVYLLPRPEGLVRWTAFAKGSSRTLADAKAQADAAIAQIATPSDNAHLAAQGEA